MALDVYSHKVGMLPPSIRNHADCGIRYHFGCTKVQPYR